MPTTAIFVYGTLKRGQRNHRFLAGQEFLREASTLPRYRLYDQGRYPCLIEDLTGGVEVRGEVWRVDDALLPRLDELEEAPVLYSRQLIALAGAAGQAWGYVYLGDVGGFADCGTCWPLKTDQTVAGNRP